jgi:hypothetical protein
VPFALAAQVMLRLMPAGRDAQELAGLVIHSALAKQGDVRTDEWLPLLDSAALMCLPQDSPELWQLLVRVTLERLAARAVADVEQLGAAVEGRHAAAQGGATPSRAADTPSRAADTQLLEVSQWGERMLVLQRSGVQLPDGLVSRVEWLCAQGLRVAAALESEPRVAVDEMQDDGL